MAFHWRIRHKLMLGLGLVFCTLALVLAGTLKGLASYRATTNIMDSKLVELAEVQKLKADLADLDVPADDGKDEVNEMRAKVRLARASLEAYREKLQVTLDRHRDPDGGWQENQLLNALTERFAALDQAIDRAGSTRNLGMTDSKPLRQDRAVDLAIRGLARACEELNESIYHDIFKRITKAKTHYQSSLVLVVATCGVGVFLMVGLLRFFYRWTFAPLRTLQEGVARVGEGDFDHPIEVHSRDEMEELAAAFNNMTRRLQEMYADLENQVNERSRQLVRSERLASVGFLAAGVAHEINNPLASIAFCSEALERRLSAIGNRLAAARPRPAASAAPTGPQLWLGAEASEPETDRRQPVAEEDDWDVVSRYLKMIQEEAFRCKAITQRLLEFSRGGERRREPTDLASLIQSVLDMVQHLETSKGKRIIFQPLGPSPAAWVNAQDIKSVVLNLVVNSLESMEEGGVLTVRLSQRERMAELIFQDTGCGMTAEVLENIFEPFFTRSRTGKGTGLGLSISHRVVSQHGGAIEATSAGANQGSTFIVRLPLKPVESGKEETLGHAAA